MFPRLSSPRTVVLIPTAELFKPGLYVNLTGILQKGTADWVRATFSCTLLELAAILPNSVFISTRRNLLRNSMMIRGM